MMPVLCNIFSFSADKPLLFTQKYFWGFFLMVYLIYLFICYFPISAHTYRQLHQKQHVKLHLRNVFLLLASWFFYYKTSGIFLLILLFVTVSDWLIARQIVRTRHTHRAKIWLVLSVCIDLGLLCYFKYAYFFINLFNDLLGTSWSVFDVFAYIGNGFSYNGQFLVDQILLPVGISFFLFQVISYTVDVYKGRIKTVDNLLDFGFYVSFFPQLVAGPIVRATEFIPQLYKPFHLNKHIIGISLFWILNGLAKKIILSDFLAINLVDRIFANPHLFSGFENLFAIFVYSLQVYADFSGYTDIAIGLALLMGFKLPKNFDSPYKARNPQEFWRRWHMSLSRWLKTYLYIPLGGNRDASFGTYFWISLIAIVGVILSGSILMGLIVIIIGASVLLVALLYPKRHKKIYANLNSFITMLLGGLWHGASWNFMIWGGLNGIGMIVYKWWKDMSWHVRMGLVSLVVIGLILAFFLFNLPILNLFIIWVVVIWMGTLVRYLHWAFNGSTTNFSDVLAKVWAILQTFVFITFTRLFFRSSSNIDPETANTEAWETAKAMVQQISLSWNGSVIPDVLWQYRVVFLLFIVGMLIHWLPTKIKQWYRIKFVLLPWWAKIPLAIIIIFLVYQFYLSDQQAFIYFQF